MSRIRGLSTLIELAAGMPDVRGRPSHIHIFETNSTTCECGVTLDRALRKDHWFVMEVGSEEDQTVALQGDQPAAL